MKKNYKIGLLVAAMVAVVPLVLIATNYQSSATSERPKEIVVDFSVRAGDMPVVVERGKMVTVPVRIEAPNDAEKTLTIRLAPEHGTIDPNLLDTALSKTSIALSKNDLVAGKVTDLSNGRGLRDVATLTLSPPTDLKPGIYSFGLEAVEEVNTELADGLLAGTLVYVQVK